MILFTIDPCTSIIDTSRWLVIWVKADLSDSTIDLRFQIFVTSKSMSLTGSEGGGSEGAGSPIGGDPKTENPSKKKSTRKTQAKNLNRIFRFLIFDNFEAQSEWLDKWVISNMQLLNDWQIFKNTHGYIRTKRLELDWFIPNSFNWMTLKRLTVIKLEYMSGNCTLSFAESGFLS